jgi:hypothetical protein
MLRPHSDPEPRRAPHAQIESAVGTSGLTAAFVSPEGLFGSEHHLEFLVRLHVGGPTAIPGIVERGLLSSGLVVRVVHGRWERTVWALDHRHPAHDELRAVLRAISGRNGRRATAVGSLPPFQVDRRTPLSHRKHAAFPVLHVLALADTPLDAETIARRVTECWPKTVAAGLKALRAGGIVEQGQDGLRLADGVPPEYVTLVRRIGQSLGLPDRYETSGPRPCSFAPANDGAPRLFGTDARLRNLMALAKHGPLLMHELRRITGAGHLRLERRDHAQFGRGGVVRSWKTEHGAAVMLDPDHPVHLPLRRLLVALERVYPLRPYVPEYEAPAPPPCRKWVGDRHALFGDIIPTSILTSIGVHGWTFEALCCALINHDRWNIKKSMRRLEDEGVLQGDRPRGPGFNARVVTIADAFPAKADLEAVLRAYVEAWPQTATAVQRGFEKIARERPRGKAHLAKRGLWPY